MATYTGLLPGEKPLVLVTHDESKSSVNDGKRQGWMKKGQQPLRQKTEGKEGDEGRECARKREEPSSGRRQLEPKFLLVKTFLPDEAFCFNSETPTPLALSKTPKGISRWPPKYRSKPVICRARTTAEETGFLFTAYWGGNILF